MEYVLRGETPLAVVWLDMAPDYHAYAHEPGPMGKPTELTVSAQGVAVPSRVWYPPGEATRDIFDPAALVRIYQGRVPLFAELPAKGVHEARLDLLLCSAKHCLPVERVIPLELPPTPPPPADAQPWFDRWSALLAQAPVTRIAAAPDAPLPTPATVHNFTPRYWQDQLEVAGLGKALLLGLLAGLLLNVMPCVLPVLTLKVSALLVLDTENKEVRLRRFRSHNFWFAGGILTFFTILAVLFSALELLWGQIFQSPATVLGMLMVVFLLGLSMLGVFTLPVLDLKAGTGQSPRAQAYFTGMLATLLATPCSGPLLGGVLGWAFTQPATSLLIVFLAVGAGMSLPYGLFALRPSLAAILPRPGPWMGILERLVGFFLLGTSLYLLSLLPSPLHMATLAALLVLALGGWIWGRFCGYDAPPQRRRILGGALALLPALLLILLLRPAPPATLWEPFTPEAFHAALGNEPLLLEFTADWCPNCKALEYTALTRDNVRAWQKDYGLRLLRVDLTRPHGEAQNLLKALGSSSIPLTAIFPPGDAARSPLILRDLYSPRSLEQALRQTLQNMPSDSRKPLQRPIRLLTTPTK